MKKLFLSLLLMGAIITCKCQKINEVLFDGEENLGGEVNFICTGGDEIETNLVRGEKLDIKQMCHNRFGRFSQPETPISLLIYRQDNKGGKDELGAFLLS